MEELEQAAYLYGVSPAEAPHWSPRELLYVVEAGRKRDQRTAVFIHTHAALCSRAISGKMPPVYEAFPLWSSEEIWRMKAERLKEKLLQRSKQEGGERG